MAPSNRTNKHWLLSIIAVVAIALLGVILFPRLFPGITDEESITLGAVLPLSGPSAHIGLWQQRGMDLAVDELNADGGIGGRSLRIRYEDSESVPKNGVTALQNLLALSSPPAVFLSLSSVASATLPIIEDRGLVSLLLAVSLPDITTRGAWTYRFNLGSDDEAEAMATYLADHTPFSKIAVAYLNDEFGVGAHRVFQNMASSRDLTVVATEPYDKDATDFRTLVTKLAQTDPDAIYVIGYLRASVLLVKQIRELGIEAQVLGNMALSVPSFLDLGGAALDGAIFTVTDFTVDSDNAQTRAFVSKYRQRYDEAPTFFSAFAYDALTLVAKAMRERGISPRDIRAGLNDIEGALAAMGTITINSKRDVQFPTRVVINQGGTIAPAPRPFP